MASEPRDVAQWIETEAALPAGAEERFAGYGIMGLSFSSGHILALRRFPASSIGPGYTSVWHRDPAGSWAFYSDIDPRLSCSRYFADALARSERGVIAATWSEPRTLSVAVWAARLTWEVQLAETAATRLLNGLAAALPAPVWRQPAALNALASVAGWALGTGPIRLQGCTPNGQHFRVNPGRLWVIEQSRAWIDGVDLGVPMPLPRQARLDDFLIPRRGLFVSGSAFFAPSARNIARHESEYAPR